MALTTCTKDIYDAFYSDDISKGLFHGHTYSANPLACTAALAGVELLQSDNIQNNIKDIIALHQAFGNRIKNHPKVKSIRQVGVIFALDLNIEMERYGNLRDKLFKFFYDQRCLFTTSWQYYLYSSTLCDFQKAIRKSISGY